MRALLVGGRVKRRGPTTVVTEPKVILPLAIGSYTEAPTKGMTTTRIPARRSEDCADGDRAELLQITPGEAANKTRVRLHHTPTGHHRFVSTAHIPVCECPDSTSF
ncbi:hypothetical protein EEB13_03065 [Rhodococcus sp. WS3]|nr:hypothetical protein EEB13_03065 [Rhodococcus sp. WS3]